MSTLTTYQTQSRQTYFTVPTENMMAYLALGLTNEAGEVAGKIKKIFRDKDGNFGAEETEQLKKELGDVLWYLTQMCTNLGLTLEEVAEANLTKILSRLERGTIRGDGDNR